jgi:RHH-type transcriptional regulator, rel operon repressor / antitoxin RelB
MTQISARLPQQLVEKIDRAASELNRSRAQIVRQALEYYLEDVEDLRVAVERLNDPADVVLDWEEVKRGLLDKDQGQRRKGTASHRPRRPRAADRRHRSAGT